MDDLSNGMASLNLSFWSRVPADALYDQSTLEAAFRFVEDDELVTDIAVRAVKMVTEYQFAAHGHPIDAFHAAANEFAAEYARWQSESAMDDIEPMPLSFYLIGNNVLDNEPLSYGREDEDSDETNELCMQAEKLIATARSLGEQQDLNTVLEWYWK